MNCDDCDDTGTYQTTHVRRRSDGTVAHGNPGTPTAGGWALDTKPITRACPCKGSIDLGLQRSDQREDDDDDLVQ